MAAELIGEAKCWNPRCGKPAPVKLTATKKLFHRCDWCDFKQYADPGTMVYRDLMAETTRAADPAPPPAPVAAEPAPLAPAPEPKTRASWTNPMNPGA